MNMQEMNFDLVTLAKYVRDTLRKNWKQPKLQVSMLIEVDDTVIRIQSPGSRLHIDLGAPGEGVIFKVDDSENTLS